MRIELFFKTTNFLVLNSFINFLKLFFLQKKIEFQFFFVKKIKKKKVFSVLKSPHINKKAGKKFNKITYNSSCICFFINTKKILLILKSFINFFFPSIFLKILYNFCLKNNFITIITPKKIYSRSFIFKKETKPLKLLKKLEIYGEYNYQKRKIFKIV